MFEPLPPGVDLPLHLTAARQKQEIAGALERAGFRTVDQPDGGALLLRVTIGVAQRSRPCGTLNNVRYELRAQNRTLLQAEAKGWTGTCEPNVFDDVSRALRRRLIAVTPEGGTP